jgi:hypothetical protein
MLILEDYLNGLPVLFSLIIPAAVQTSGNYRSKACSPPRVRRNITLFAGGDFEDFPTSSKLTT